MQTSQPPSASPPGYLPASEGPSPAPGYPPNGAAVSYAQPYQPGSRGPVAPLPPSMVTAVRLMNAGAVYALVWAIGAIAISASIIRNHPVVNATFGQRLAGATFFIALVAVIDIALWLGVARACRRGRNGARVTGTVLFAVHTLGALGILVAAQAGLGPAKVLAVIGWLIGLGAVVYLWQRSSSAFFSAHRSR